MPSKLHAQATPERAEGRNQDRTAILRVHRDITLSEQVIAIGDSLPVAGPKLVQSLAHTDVEEGLHLKEGLAIGVQTRDRFAANPFVTGSYLGARAGQFGGNVCPNGIVHGI